MSIDISQVVSATLATLAPFWPIFLEMGKVGGNRLVEIAVENGNEKAWRTASALWNKITTRLGNDAELLSAAVLASKKKDDIGRQGILAEVLHAKLTQNNSLLQDLYSLLGEDTGIQQVLAENNSWIENVMQKSGDNSKQIVKAVNNSVVLSVRQFHD